MELKREFKLGTQQLLGLYRELEDIMDMNRDVIGPEYTCIREFIENIEEAIQPLKNQVRQRMEEFLIKNRDLLNSAIKSSEMGMGNPYEKLSREWDELSNDYYTLLENE